MTFKTDFTKLNTAGAAEPRGLYDPKNEHDNCGTGFVAKLDGKPSHQLVLDAVKVLINLEHRGAVGGDERTGDGAGLLINIPDAFFQRVCKSKKIKLPKLGNYGVAMLFLPTVEKAAAKCKRAFKKIVEKNGCELLGWRDVPIYPDDLGKLSLNIMPKIEQAFVKRGAKIKKENFERKLYVIRRELENEVAKWKDNDYSQFYVPSFSSKTIVYKGMLTGVQLNTFFKDIHEEDFASSFGIVHQRFSTNTLPVWSLAQPFRCVAHNGEINTLRGNINSMRGRESIFSSPLFGDDIKKITPVINENGSDSAIFDNALELLIMSGRSLPHSAMMMVPEAWNIKYLMSEDKRAFYEYHSAIMEPWDGPAALVFTDGRYIGATLDRNGLRPARYTISRDGLVILSSETGVIEVPPEKILKRGRLQPGKMFLVDMEQHRIVPDKEIKSKISRQQPYRHWVNKNRILLRGLFAPSELPKENPEELLIKQHAFGYTEEELKMILSPMASNGQEGTGSMGNDAALAALSNKPRLLFDYFHQLFAQVTNPAIDPLREELVMSLMSFVGREKNLLDETPEHCRRLKLFHPILTPEDLNKIRNAKNPDIIAKDIDILFPADGSGKELEAALQNVFKQAEKHIADGATILILTDKNISKENAAIPSLLAIAGLHHHLIRKGLRSSASIIVDTGEAREVNHFALLIGYGASAICPNVAFSTVMQMAENKMLANDISPETATDKYITAIKKGLLKTLSRMGISTIRSYRGAQIFEAVGLGKEVTNKYFAGTASRIGGVTLNEIAKEAVARHRKGFPKRKLPEKVLQCGGEYHVRAFGERHLWTPEAVYKLQHAVRTGDYSVFKEYSKLINDQSKARATLRSLFKFKKGKRKSIPLSQVEPVEEITKRFASAAMSFGSISREAHEAIAIAMNRIGGRSNSGEGGEDPARYIPLPNGDSKLSRIKQVASGRFGVTIDYLVHADELQIKVAQGAKPGEGGQLPSHKVSPEIAKVRHTTPGVTLISPPPHHDIYSIEDLAQLIYDLRCSNPKARISVKLVSEVGVGTIAAGVAKAKADMVLISGFDGGTGASPLTSIKHCGLPWELGLAETQQSLINNHLRDRIRVQTDGQLKTGRDLAIAALMGAEEYGFGTTCLACLGCIIMRKCHMNTCPVGIATQDPRLRKNFAGKPEYVVNFLKFIAQELREIMAELGFKKLDDMIGKIDHLEFQPAIDHWKSHGLDLTPLLAKPLNKKAPLICDEKKTEVFRTVQIDKKTKLSDIDTDNETVLKSKSLEKILIKLAQPALKNAEPVTINLPIRNVHRTVGTTLSYEITKKYGAKGLPDNTIQINFTGSAGQSFGAFLARGITMRVEGDINDYTGKGLSGGKIIVVPHKKSHIVPHKNVIVGNVVLYGATDGEIYINGIAAERFAIRNSGATAVVEGVGDHGCEYMTGGTVVVLGRTGVNFAAGMSGGIAYVFDDTEMFGSRCNLDMVDLEYVWTDEDKSTLKKLIQNHYKYTNSERAKNILDDWENSYPLFVKVMPIEYKRVLERMKLEERRDNETVPATEEVYPLDK